MATQPASNDPGQSADTNAKRYSGADDGLNQPREARYRALFNRIGEGFHISELIYDAAGRVIDWRFLDVNQVFEQQTGIRNAAGRLGSELVACTETHWLEVYDQVVRTGEPLYLENYNASTDRWYSAQASRVGEAGSRQFAVVFTDITDRKQHDRQQTYLLALGDALRSITDPVAIEEAVTRLALRYFNADRCWYGRIEAGHVIISRDAMRDDLPAVAGTYPMSEFIRPEKVVDDGQPVAVYDVRTTPMPDENRRASCQRMQLISLLDVPVVKSGQAAGVLRLGQSTPRTWTEGEKLLAIETAERTWAAVERARAENALKQADRRKDEFMAMLGYELRNPLATISNTLLVLELTQGTDASLPYDKAVRLMSREATHLNRIVDDLLDMSRIRQGEVRLERQRVNLGAVVGQAVDVVRPLYRQQDRQLTFRQPAAPLYVYGDETRLAQVVMNLLTNGLKYTTEGGHVWVNLEPLEQRALLRVADDGIGIRPNELHAIFEVFVQGNAARDRPQGGLGLGLAVVRQLVQAHEGRVEAFSEGPGRGSEFRIELPLLPDALPPPRPAANGLAADQSASPGRVLVVDDNKDLADMTARLIQMRGYEVHTCYSGPKALETAAALLPQVVLLDIGMPELDGYAVCAQMRRQPWGKSMAIIALSGYSQEQDKQRSRAAGFDDRLLKPINYQVLIDTLGKYIGF